MPSSRKSAVEHVRQRSSVQSPSVCYERQNVRLEVRTLDGRPVLAAYVDGNATPSYFMLLGFADGRVQSIRDFRYVPYIVADANLIQAAPNVVATRGVVASTR